MSVISLDDARKKLAKRLKSDSPSKLNTPWDEHGQTPTELDENTEIALLAMYEVLIEAWAGGFTTKSKFARESANIIAVAATEGLITTRLEEEVWGNHWMITEKGMQFMKEIHDDVVS